MRRMLSCLIPCLIMSLAAGEVSAGEILLRNGWEMTCRIRGDTPVALIVDHIVYQIGGANRGVMDGVMTVQKADIEMLILDETDRYTPTGKETFEISGRGEEVEEPRPSDLPPPKPGSDEPVIIKTKLLPDNPEDPVDGPWRPTGVGREIEAKELGLAMLLPQGFRHEIVQKGNRSVLRAISPPEDEFGLGFDVMVIKRQNFAPFDTFEGFYRFSRDETQKILEGQADKVTMKRTVRPARLPIRIGNAPRDARGVVYEVTTGKSRKLIEMRVLKTWSNYYVFTFSSPPGMSRHIASIYEKCFSSVRDLE